MSKLKWTICKIVFLFVPGDANVSEFDRGDRLGELAISTAPAGHILNQVDLNVLTQDYSVYCLYIFLYLEKGLGVECGYALRKCHFQKIRQLINQCRLDATVSLTLMTN